MFELIKKLREKQDLFGFAQRGDEVDQIISEMEEFVLNDQYFELINEHGTFKRKITYVKNGVFEWNSGWANVSQLRFDPNRKIKYILNQNGKADN